MFVLVEKTWVFHVRLFIIYSTNYTILSIIVPSHPILLASLHKPINNSLIPDYVFPEEIVSSLIFIAHRDFFAANSRDQIT